MLLCENHASNGLNLASRIPQSKAANHLTRELARDVLTPDRHNGERAERSEYQKTPVRSLGLHCQLRIANTYHILGATWAPDVGVPRSEPATHHRTKTLVPFRRHSDILQAGQQ